MGDTNYDLGATLSVATTIGCPGDNVAGFLHRTIGFWANDIHLGPHRGEPRHRREWELGRRRAPNFAGDATTDSAIFSASTNTAIELRNVTTGDTFASATFDVSAPAYTFSLPAGNTTNDLIILPNGSMTNNSAHTQDFTALPDININGAAGFPGVLAAANGDASTKLSFDLHQLTFDNIDASTGANTTLDLSAGYNVRTVSINGVASSSLSVVDAGNGAGGTLFITGDSGTNNAAMAINGGTVQISNGNALGGTGRIVTGPYTSDGQLAITGNITVPKDITIYGRENCRNIRRSSMLVETIRSLERSGPGAVWRLQYRVEQWHLDHCQQFEHQRQQRSWLCIHG